jgi:hypothetical protein
MMDEQGVLLFVCAYYAWAIVQQGAVTEGLSEIDLLFWGGVHMVFPILCHTLHSRDTFCHNTPGRQSLIGTSCMFCPTCRTQSPQLASAPYSCHLLLCLDHIMARTTTVPPHLDLWPYPPEALEYRPLSALSLCSFAPPLSAPFCSGGCAVG